MVNRIPPYYFLAVGLVTLPAAHMTVSVDLAGWISCVPFLLFLHNTSGLRSKLVLGLGLAAAWSLCIAKILSPPMPAVMIFLFSIPITLFQLPGYLLWDRFKDRPWSTLLFPAVMTTMEWIQYTYTPFASWGVAAYTQSHQTAMMQTVSLFGMPGLSFLIYWINVSVADILSKRSTSKLTLQAPFAAALVLLAFGALRYDWSKTIGKNTIKVAAVGTDSEVGGYPLPSKEKNDEVKRNLFSRTESAARSGAKLIVWNEGATFILPEEEAAWRDSLSALSKRCRTPLVASFIIPVSESPMQYKNNYLFFNEEGTLLYTYNKHQPVPGEPATKGTEPLKAFDIEGVKTGAAICYDYDFPYLARGFGALGADLVAIPSSDWRGIDPLHTRMAAFRAVEQGHSILRSTRFGMSAAITPYGEFAASMSSYDNNDKIMTAHLPTKGVTTLYRTIGDVFIYGCIGFIVWFMWMGRRRG